VSDSHAARTRVRLEIDLGGYLHNPHASRVAEFAVHAGGASHALIGARDSHGCTGHYSSFASFTVP